MKFEVKKDSFEIKLGLSKRFNRTHSQKEVEDAYFDLTCSDPAIVKSFDSEDDAKEFLSKCRPYTSLEHSYGGYAYLLAEVFFVDAVEYDEDGDFVSGEIIDFKCDGYDDPDYLNDESEEE